MGEGDPRLSMVLRAFGKHLRKNAIPDEDILSGLAWIQRMVVEVLGDETLPVIPDEEDFTTAGEVGEMLTLTAEQLVDAGE